MGGFPILSAMTFLPLAGALLIMLVRAATAGSRSVSSDRRQDHAILTAALVISVATFVLSVAAGGAVRAAPHGRQPGGE